MEKQLAILLRNRGLNFCRAQKACRCFFFFCVLLVSCTLRLSCVDSVYISSCCPPLGCMTGLRWCMKGFLSVWSVCGLLLGVLKQSLDVWNQSVVRGRRIPGNLLCGQRGGTEIGRPWGKIGVWLVASEAGRARQRVSTFADSTRPFFCLPSLCRWWAGQAGIWGEKRRRRELLLVVYLL